MRPEKVVTIAALLLINACFISGQDSITTNLDEYIDSVFDSDKPGVVVLVTRHGQKIYERAVGLASIEIRTLLQPDMLFNIASMSKQFLAVAILKLAEEGKFALTDTVSKFLPDYPATGSRITIEHLLSHTSGIPSFTKLDSWISRAQTRLTREQILDTFSNEELEFEPGTRIEYSNSGYFLLGLILEKVSGESLEEFFRANIFEPAGMVDTFIDDGATVHDRMVTTCYQLYDGEIIRAPYMNMRHFYSTGGLVSSVADMARWDQALHEGKILNSEYLEKCFTEYTLADGSPSGSAFGWFVSSLDGRTLYHHGGTLSGNNADGIRVNEEGLYVTMLSNLADPQRGNFFHSVALNVVRIALGQDLNHEPEAVILTVQQLERLVGIYEATTGRFKGLLAEITLENSHIFFARGDSRTEIFPESETVFFIPGKNSKISFDLDENGRPLNLNIHRGGAGGDIVVLERKK